DQFIEGDCTLPSGSVLTATSSAHFVLERNGDAMSGRISWQGAASVACGQMTDVAPKWIDVAGVRIGNDIEPQSSISLLRKVARYPPLARLIGVVVKAPTIACPDASYWFPPGSCSPLILCGGSPPSPEEVVWLIDADHGLHLIYTGRGAASAFDVCGGSETGTTNTILEYATGQACGTSKETITVSPPLTAIASASPSSIRPGERAQLSVAVSGGIPPYSYAWLPATGL